ncbi:hypothetical protein AAF712_004850 [Marasmius tenuissimus]|uniref:Uncharacterized protein n=1 Tax=Marasmius tenuissimus TaxID=585030 RepID=A0ABR3A2K0_9AGAR
MTDQTSSSPQPQTDHSGIIIGTSVGIVTFVLLVIFGIGYVRRQKKKVERASIAVSSVRVFIAVNTSYKTEEGDLERGIDASEEQALIEGSLSRRDFLNEDTYHEKETTLEEDDEAVGLIRHNRTLESIPEDPSPSSSIYSSSHSALKTIHEKASSPSFNSDSSSQSTSYYSQQEDSISFHTTSSSPPPTVPRKLPLPPSLTVARKPLPNPEEYVHNSQSPEAIDLPNPFTLPNPFSRPLKSVASFSSHATTRSRSETGISVWGGVEAARMPEFASEESQPLRVGKTVQVFEL